MQNDDLPERWEIPPAIKSRMSKIARLLRNSPTPSEHILWQAIRRRQLDGRRFRRQMPIGSFVVDFYCSSERLAVEVDGPIHEAQQAADQTRQELIEALGIRFVRVTAAQVEQALRKCLRKFALPSICGLLFFHRRVGKQTNSLPLFMWGPSTCVLGK